MPKWAEIRQDWQRFTDAAQPFKRYTRFTHDLTDFPRPERRKLPDPLPEVAILTPCKNAAGDLDLYFDLIDALDYPKDRLHLFMLEGDSTDDTFQAATRGLAGRRGAYAGAELIKHDLGFEQGEGRRNRPGIQHDRRAAIARCRNRLMRAALATGATHFLFIDVDMVAVPPATLRDLLEFDAPILAANCLLQDTDRVFDLNTFRYERPVSDRMARRFVVGGLYQPPRGYFRRYPDFRQGNAIEQVHSVGGTCLLIRRDVPEAGVDFPQAPYQLHIETEALALKAADMGFGSFVVPQVIVYHGWET
jgi:mannan polymerase complexes MNN9 subunit